MSRWSLRGQETVLVAGRNCQGQGPTAFQGLRMSLNATRFRVRVPPGHTAADYPCNLISLSLAPQPLH